MQNSNFEYDWLVVGAGLSGSTFAERLATVNKSRVLVIDKRDHIGGNAYDFVNEIGILTHRYGPHIFHTNSKKVWDYLSRFTAWRMYEHKVRAVINNTEVVIPFNLNSIYQTFSSEKADIFEKRLKKHFVYGENIPILKFKEIDDPVLNELAEFIYKNVFYGYTKKQWGVLPNELSPSVTARVPVCVCHDDRYFHDEYQAMPENGYTSMITNMLDNDLIEIQLNTSFQDIRDQNICKNVVYTGPIDEYYEYEYGQLPYRSLEFKFENLDMEYYQDVATINYPNDHEYTRITEQKYLSGQASIDKTTLIYEYPQQYSPGLNEPYYPIPEESNNALYRKYQKKAEEDKGSIIFSGRLADYKYYNMDQAVARALSIFEKRLKI